MRERGLVRFRYLTGVKSGVLGCAQGVDNLGVGVSFFIKAQVSGNGLVTILFLGVCRGKKITYTMYER